MDFTDTKYIVTCPLDSWGTFLCQQMWASAKLCFCSILDDTNPAVDSWEPGNYTHPDSAVHPQETRRKRGQDLLTVLKIIVIIYKIKQNRTKQNKIKSLN